MAPSDKEVSGNALSNAKISKPSSPSSSANNNRTSDKEVSSDEEEQCLFTQPNAVDLTVDKEDKDKQCTTEVTNKHGSSQYKKKRKGTSDGSSQYKKKKQHQEVSDANLANQLKKVPALNANDSLLQATQMTDFNHKDKEGDDEETLKVTKYFTMSDSGKKQSLWWEGFQLFFPKQTSKSVL